MTWLPTESGRIFELLAPDWRQVDFDIDIPNALARIPRFTGHIGSGPYSVGQHSVVGADAVFRDTGDRKAAGCFLLHDAHEYVLNDKATPIAEAEAALAEQDCAGAGRIVREVNRRLKQSVDVAIYQAAGLGTSGCPAAFRDIVRAYDLRMLATERNHFLGRGTRLWHPSIEQAEPLRLSGKLKVWPWPDTADEFRERLRRYLPERFGASPSSPKPAPRPAARQPVEA
ncbi:hypothetical protein [Bosea sp. BK604]|uniref:hypothetical protein n=1 Tax=Bosea sp. BK604 TaxID=2512180 RepID=UPI001046412A|nr:hypothetical protein [Bosea sp. BK604]TCR69718.1 hypothetical protein EV560_101115 [Bosea sp. BK604]